AKGCESSTAEENGIASVSAVGPGRAPVSSRAAPAQHRSSESTAAAVHCFQLGCHERPQARSGSLTAGAAAAHDGAYIYTWPIHSIPILGPSRATRCCGLHWQDEHQAHGTQALPSAHHCGRGSVQRLAESPHCGGGEGLYRGRAAGSKESYEPLRR
ncbi:hypothetical protein B484DRAFT_161947, partial [Ochromonadaceae sp. CCMP2298]